MVPEDHRGVEASVLTNAIHAPGVTRGLPLRLGAGGARSATSIVLDRRASRTQGAWIPRRFRGLLLVGSDIGRAAEVGRGE